MFLYDSIEQAKVYGSYAELPDYIKDNLNPKFEIRSYQDAAFRNFITYYENENLRKNGNRILFHMATGSGKTYIMAGLILYLYQKGYRNFLFFVPLNSIKSKTIDNFTVPSSQKYLFAKDILIDGEVVKIKTVNSFQDSSPDCINICFTTIQQIHHDYWDVRENGITFEEMQEKKIVFISDEAHHLNADTAKNKAEEEESRSWEYVAKRLFKANPDNFMLEFTATCKLDNPLILQEYENKIVYEYDLKHFRHDRYSKEVKAFQSDLDYLDMCLQAMVLSQYRLHLFNDLKQDIKPVILFKSAKKNDSDDFLSEFDRMVDNLNGDRLTCIYNMESQIIQSAFTYFENKGISLDLLAKELHEGFGVSHRIQVKDDSAIKSNDRILNTLEEPDNPIRAIFEVKALDEGWDVLNLFDIVRLYDTRDAKNGIPGKTTISEAQLIGRGARYCPFVIDNEDDRYRRKFDEDLENQYRVCEEMYYHCHTNSRYIDELHKALINTGMMDVNVMVRKLHLKESFKQSRLYKSGSVLVNDQIEMAHGMSTSLPPKVRSRMHHYTVPGRLTTVSQIMLDNKPVDPVPESVVYSYTVRQIAEMNYNTVYSAIRRFPRFKLSGLQNIYPCIKSMRQFITSDDFLGEIHIDILSCDGEPTQENLFRACLKMAEEIASSLSDIDKQYAGSTKFRLVPFKDIFRDKVINYQDVDTEIGRPQSESVNWCLDLSDKEWYVFNENYGTGEEKGFVKHFYQTMKPLLEKYDDVYLVRNERHMHIYSFDGGSRFEPDYLLFLTIDGEPINQLQVFIEPKGTNLFEKDCWKQDFLLELAEKWNIDPTSIIDNSEYRLEGMPFYNNSDHIVFDKAFKEL